MLRVIKRQDETLYKALRFIASAMAKESTRYALNYIYVRGKEVVATDGKRLHWLTGQHPLKPGFYEVVKSTASEIVLNKMQETPGNFPKWHGIIPKSTSGPVDMAVHPAIWLSQIFRNTYSVDNRGFTKSYNPGFVFDASIYDYSKTELYPSKLYVPLDIESPIRISYDLQHCNRKASALIMPLTGEQVKQSA